MRRRGNHKENQKMILIKQISEISENFSVKMRKQKLLIKRKLTLLRLDSKILNMKVQSSTLQKLKKTNPNKSKKKNWNKKKRKRQNLSPKITNLKKKKKSLKPRVAVTIMIAINTIQENVEVVLYATLKSNKVISQAIFKWLQDVAKLMKAL